MKDVAGPIILAVVLVSIVIGFIAILVNVENEKINEAKSSYESGNYYPLNGQAFVYNGRLFWIGEHGDIHTISR